MAVADMLILVSKCMDRSTSIYYAEYELDIYTF